jgi:hypothetical protein
MAAIGRLGRWRQFWPQPGRPDQLPRLQDLNRVCLVDSRVEKEFIYPRTMMLTDPTTLKLTSVDGDPSSTSKVNLGSYKKEVNSHGATYY